ncbi:MAG TPA: response regulator [Chloroflexi bacterium]|nr:response regulator [Chloroflexota bacterium]
MSRINLDTKQNISNKKAIDPKEAHVLVVEDNLQNLVLVARLLAFSGIRHYEWKASGWQVLEFATTLPKLDLVLMDIHLPHEDGYEAMRKLKAEARFSGARVVAITADANPSSLKKAQQAGFDGFLGKPIDPDKFPDQIKAILQGQQVWDLGIHAQNNA